MLRSDFRDAFVTHISLLPEYGVAERRLAGKPGLRSSDA
jgi:hypothetical protein